jgi:perosamine synthetase
VTILFAVGDCFSAFLLEPVLRELRARGVAFRVAAGVLDHELVGLRNQLGPDACVRVMPSSPADPTFLEVAASHAEELLRTRPTCLAYVGVTPFLRHLAGRAEDAAVRVVRLDAGVRAFGRATLEHPFANAWCVTGELERLALLERGMAPDDVTVVGDLVAEAVACVHPGTPDAPRGAARVHEHRPASAAAYLEEMHPAGLPWLEPPSRDADVATWIAHVAAAEVMTTDSVGWQRVAVALGVPCVVHPTSDLWAPGVATGLVTQQAMRESLHEVVERAARHRRGEPAAATGVAARIVDMLLGTPRPAPLALPSETDASGRTFGNDEAALVSLVLQRGTLNSTRGTMVTAFEKRFAQWLGCKHAIACASGSAAVHCAIAALRLSPGDEVITTPITDMGAITPILYEGGVPVFADVDPVTLNVTADTVRAQLTDRTRAIVVTHLFGSPCDLDALQALARERDLALIEDAAQAFGATWRGRNVGTLGRLGTFSLQQGKHITTGEGGIVATDDDELARRVFLYVNKAWGYGDPKPDHYFPALNYRLTELQGAVALAQLPKLSGVVAARRDVAAGLQRALADVQGLVLPQDPAHGEHSWWKFAFHVDPRVVAGGPRALAKQLQAAGVACAPHYVQKPAFACELFRDWRASPVTWLPLQHNPRRDRAAAMFDRAAYPGALGGLDTVVVLPINERYTTVHVEHVANAIRAGVAALRA